MSRRQSQPLKKSSYKPSDGCCSCSDSEENINDVCVDAINKLKSNIENIKSRSHMLLRSSDAKHQVCTCEEDCPGKPAPKYEAKTLEGIKEKIDQYRCNLRKNVNYLQEKLRNKSQLEWNDVCTAAACKLAEVHSLLNNKEDPCRKQSIKQSSSTGRIASRCKLNVICTDSMSSRSEVLMKTQNASKTIGLTCSDPPKAVSSINKCEPPRSPKKKPRKKSVRPTASVNTSTCPDNSKAIQAREKENQEQNCNCFDLQEPTGREIDISAEVLCNEIKIMPDTDKLCICEKILIKRHIALTAEELATIQKPMDEMIQTTNTNTKTQECICNERNLDLMSKHEQISLKRSNMSKIVDCRESSAKIRTKMSSSHVMATSTPENFEDICCRCQQTIQCLAAAISKNVKTVSPCHCQMYKDCFCQTGGEEEAGVLNLSPVPTTNFPCPFGEMTSKFSKIQKEQMNSDLKISNTCQCNCSALTTCMCKSTIQDLCAPCQEDDNTCGCLRSGLGIENMGAGTCLSLGFEKDEDENKCKRKKKKCRGKPKKCQDVKKRNGRCRDEKGRKNSKCRKSRDYCPPAWCSPSYKERTVEWGSDKCEYICKPSLACCSTRILCQPQADNCCLEYCERPCL